MINALVVQADFLRQQILAAERQVDTRTVSYPMRDTLFHTLESNQRVIESIEEKSATTDEFARAQIQNEIKDFKDLNKRIITLYGRIHTLAVSKEISDIAEKAKRLELALHNGSNRKQIEEETSHLKEHIQTFTQDHALGRKDRHTMATVRATIHKADSFLQGYGLREDTPPHLFNQFNLLSLKPTEYKSLADDEVEVETVLELFEIAERLFHGNNKEGLLRFNQLTEEARNRFCLHLTLLGESTGDPLANRTKTAQALIATAYDLADSHDGEPYLSEIELTKLFDTARSFG